MNVVPNRPFFPEEDRDAIAGVIKEILESGQLTLGKYTAKLETEFRLRCNTPYAVAVSSGTAALEVIFRWLVPTILADPYRPKEVIVPTNTFIATPNAVKYAGATPVFADISRHTLSLSVEGLVKALNEDGCNPIAACLVHIGGFVNPDFLHLKAILGETPLTLVEDAAHAHGALWEGEPVGSLGVAGAFSFFPTKVITSCEGGMITTMNDDLAEYARCVRDQGKDPKNADRIKEYGYNWRMSEVHAAIGLYQLRRMNTFIRARHEIAKVYDDELKPLAPKLVPLREAKGTASSYYKYVVFLNGVDRKDLKNRLQWKGLRLPGEVYAIPCHLQPIYDYPQGSFPEAEYACGNHICLPIHAAMGEEEAKYVASALREALS